MVDGGGPAHLRVNPTESPLLGRITPPETISKLTIRREPEGKEESMPEMALPLVVPRESPTNGSRRPAGEALAVLTLWRALAARDSQTAAHSRRVARLTRRVGKTLGLTPGERKTLFFAALLHDLGKLKAGDATLFKPGPLDDRERRRMEAHVLHGVRILSRFAALWALIPLVSSHHERVDGCGYPAGLVDIPLGGRIIACLDAYDSMTSDRPYRLAMPVERARQTLREGAGSQWDEMVVAAFLGPPCQGPVPRRGRPRRSSLDSEKWEQHP
jgi:HD-GYP domain-containing protein (c-di-GMP phosphodiesterase class II)